MSPEDQRIAIAEACGWIYMGSTCLKSSQWKPWIPPVGANKNTIPNYLNDLNAMHEAEKTLDGYRWSDYIIELGGFSQDPDREEWKQVCHATASQRAEAFLRTIGKWTPPPNKE